MNHNPFQARLEKRRRSRNGTLDQAKTALWKAIKEAEKILLSKESEPELKLRCVHALSQAIGQYAKVTPRWANWRRGWRCWNGEARRRKEDTSPGPVASVRPSP